MAENAKIKKFNIGSPAIYRIRVQGYLDTKWSANLAGMQITEVASGNNTDETMLVGRLEDQSSLNGVMDTLHNLNLPVLNVECLEKL
jgi:hypothetical protein